MRQYFFVLLLIFAFYQSANAASAKKPRNGTEEIFSKITHSFLNTNCAETNTCDLKEFKLVAKQYRIWVDGSWSYGASAVISYETNKVDNLENYSVVQFIRGCVFDTRIRNDGTIERGLGYVLPFFSDFDEDGKPIKFATFCFPDWVIDSTDKDPVYNSFPALGRFYARRWNSVPGSFDKKTEIFYGVEKPSRPQLYLSDITSTAFMGETFIKNTSLQFKTCIYKTKDVPLETTEDNINFATPIKCFEWQNIYIYNYDKKDFEMKFEIDPFCLKKPEE